jgi:protoporphyrinogen oxidase
MKKSSGVIGSIDLKNGPIHIFGGGICGLLFGYYLKKNNISFELHEKEKRVGGKISSTQSEDGLIESAANAIYSSPELLELLSDLEIDYLLPTPDLKKLIYRNKRARTFPLTIIEVLKIIPKLFRKIPHERFNISVYDFFKPLVGEKVCDEVLSCAFNGIYATPIKELHFKSVFSSNIKAKTYLSFFLELKKNKPNNFKPKSISFDTGLQALINRLHEYLKDHIVLNSKQTISLHQNAIICTDANDAATLIRSTHKDLANLLSTISYTRLNTTTVFAKEKLDYLEDSFGVLYPYSEDKALGIINNKAIFKNRVNNPNLYNYTIISKSLDYKLDGQQISSYKQTVWDKAFPIYNFERYNTIKQLRVELFNHPSRLAIFGNYVDGISIREMLKHTKTFCENLRKG